MSEPNDDILLDRLVDDELSADERQRLLRSFDQSGDGWRRCALAFLENQAWRRQMKSIVVPQTEDKAVVSPRTVQPVGNRMGQWLAIAAGLLLAFSVGWLAQTGSTPLGPENTQVAASEDNVAEPLPANDPGPRLDDHDVVTLLVRDDRGEAQRLRVPLVELNGSDAASDNLAGIVPDAWRRQLERQGMNLRGRRRYAPLYIEQNEEVVPMAVPVDDAYIVPVSRPVF